MTPKSVVDKTVRLLNEGKFRQAAKSAVTGQKKFPKEAVFYNLAGISMAHQGKPREAAVHFAKAVNAAPANHEFQNNLAQALASSGQHDKCMQATAKFRPARADASELDYIEGVSHLLHGRFADVVAAASRGLQAAPKSIKLLRMRASALSEIKQFEASIDDFEAIARLTPQDPEPLVQMAPLLIRRNRSEVAEDRLLQALSLVPDHVGARAALAMLYFQRGARAEAARMSAEVLALDPTQGDGVRMQALMRDKDGLPDLIADLDQQLASKPPLDTGVRAQVEFARAHASLRLGDTDAAERHFAQANALEASLRPYDADASRDRAEGLRQAIGGPVRGAIDEDGPAPILIVGMPRSGTTLFEQVLAGHPDVVGRGELEHTQTLQDDILESPDEFDIEAFARGYRAGVPDLPDNCAAFVDKLPANYLCAGAFLRAFSRARVIYVTRHPLDIAWSNWRAYFPAGGLNYVFDQRALAQEANLSRECMRHWSAAFPDRITHISYESLVGDIDAGSRRLAEAAGIDWCEDMTRPEASGAEVRTASAMQVREGVHTKSVGGGASRAEYFKTFLDGLDRDLWPELD